MSNQKGRDGKAQKQYYASYNYEANRKKRLNRHLARQPNDEQAKKALKNIHHRGPRKSENRLGWINRFETIEGFVTEKKDDKGFLYENIGGPKDAFQRAWMAKHVRDVNRRHRHEIEFNSKKKSKR